MVRSNIDLNRVLGRPTLVGVRLPAGDLFGFLRRSLDLPAPWAALITTKVGQEVVVPAGGPIVDRDAESVSLLRTGVTPVEWSHDGFTSRDKFRCRVRVQVRVVLTPEREELKSFQRALLCGPDVADVSTLAEYLEAPMRNAVARFVSEHDAEPLVQGAMSDEAAKIITEALQSSCFAAGLYLDGSPVVYFESDGVEEAIFVREQAIQRHQEHNAEERLREAARNAQRAHMEHLEDLLTRLQQLSKASPGVELVELIRAFSEKERGTIYESLLASSPSSSRTESIVVAAGDEILYFNAKDVGRQERRVRVDGAAGPVRSVRIFAADGGGPRLYFGAAKGIYQFALDAESPEHTFLMKHGGDVRGGFNSVAVVQGKVFGSHSELGLVEWPIGEPESPRPRFASLTQGAGAVRGVQSYGQDLICAVGDRILRWSIENQGEQPDYVYTGSSAAITALCIDGRRVYAGNANGDVLLWAKGQFARPERIHAGGNRPAESVCIIDGGGLGQLIYTDTSIYAYARVIGDSFVSRYEAGGQTVRRAQAAGDMIVALNELRDRFFVWKPGLAEKPVHTVNVAAMCGRTIQDIALLSSPSPAASA